MFNSTNLATVDLNFCQILIKHSISPNLVAVNHCHIFVGKWSNAIIFLNGPFPASFSFIFVFSIQLTVNKCSIYKFLPMIGFEPRTSGIESYQLSHNHCQSIVGSTFLEWLQCRTYVLCATRLFTRVKSTPKVGETLIFKLEWCQVLPLDNCTHCQF